MSEVETLASYLNTASVAAETLATTLQRKPGDVSHVLDIARRLQSLADSMRRASEKAEKFGYNAQRADHKPENRDKAGGKAF